MFDRIAQHAIFRYHHQRHHRNERQRDDPGYAQAELLLFAQRLQLFIAPAFPFTRARLNDFIGNQTPTIVRTITELAIKYQLSITLTCMVASMVLAASVLMPESSTSVVTISRLAVNPQPTPAIADSRPATG